MTETLIRIRGLRVEFDDRVILSSVDADLAAGKITALIGLNGSGKTTLLRAVLKEVPYQGTIQFRCGHDHSHPTPEHIGYVPQKHRTEATLPLTVRELLALALQRRPIFLRVSRAVEKLTVEMLATVGLQPNLLDSPVDKISGGELQRVLLALALHPKPELLLLDEPAQGVDFRDQEGFYGYIARINRELGVTVLLVSHDLSVVTKFAHHVLCLKDGHILCQGRPQEILDGTRIKETFGSEQALYAHHHHD